MFDRMAWAIIIIVYGVLALILLGFIYVIIDLFEKLQKGNATKKQILVFYGKFIFTLLFIFIAVLYGFNKNQILTWYLSFYGILLLVILVILKYLKIFISKHINKEPK
jgi:hypothetical protein